MPDRTVTYSFRANFAQFSAGLATMGKGVQDTATKLTALDRNGQKMRAGLNQLGSTAGTIGLVAAAGVAVAVRAAANFEQAMSNVQAATHETADNMEVLRQAALDAGQATKFSATEAAGAIEELAKAGVSTTDILQGGLDGALDLAAAGGLEVADAAQIAATALTQFRLAGEDVPHVADLLAAGAGKAQGDVSDLSMALKQSGLVAAQMGVSIEETTGTLAAFASAGLLGSDAGTSFRTMLLRLANPTKESAKLMESLGISAYDAQGNFVGIESLAGQLSTAFEGQTQATRDAALATIFGSDAIRAANVLYNQGATGIDNWTNKVDDQGYAAETAAIKMDNLKGDLEQLGGAFETALIGSGGGAQGPLRTLVQDVTGAVNAFNDLPGPVKSAVTALGGITAITGGGLWFGSKVIGGIANTRQALSDLGVTADRTSGSLGRMARTGAGLATLAGSISLLGQAVAEASGANIDVSDLDRQIQAIANGDSAEVLDQLSNSLGVIGGRQGVIGGTAESVNELVTAFGLFGGTAADNAAENVDKVDKALAAMVESGNAETAAEFFERFAAAQLGVLPGSSISPDYIDDLMGSFGSYDLALKNAETSAGGAAGATDEYAGATSDAGAAAADAAEDIAEMVQNMKDQKDAAVESFDAITNYRQAMKDATKQADSNNAGIKGNTKAALENRNQLSSLVSAWNSLDSTVTDNVGKFKDARDNFIKTATGMGVSKSAARDLWQEMAKLPQSKVIPVSVPGTDESTNKARTLKQILDSLKSKDIYVALHYQTIGNKPKAPTPGQSADGGSVPKTGLPYADRHPYLLADGEEVISNRYGQADRFRADRAAGRIPGYADGGKIGGDKNKARVPGLFLSEDLADLLDGVKGAAGALKVLQAQLNRTEKAVAKSEQALDRETQKRDDLANAMASLSSSVASGLRSNIFEKDDTASPWAAATAASGVAGRNAGLQDDINEGRMYASLVEALKARGLTGGALEALLAENDTDLLAEYANASQADLAAYQSLFDIRDQTLAAAGQSAGQAVFGEALDAQTQVLEDSRAEAREANRRLKDLEAAVDRLNSDNKKGQEKAADKVKDGVNGAGTKGRRNKVYAK